MLKIRRNHIVLNLIATVKVQLPLKKDIEESFPFSVGALMLHSKDGKREYCLDSSNTNYVSVYNKDDIYHLESKCEIDVDTFPISKDTYNLSKEDLDTCTGVFYCSDVDNEDGEDCFDYDNAKVVAILTDIDTGKEYQISVTLER